MLLALLPVTVAFGSLAPVQVGSMHATATDAVVLALAAGAAGEICFSAHHARSGVQSWVSSIPLSLPYRTLLSLLGALLLLMMLSALWATDRVAALKEILKWGEALTIMVVVPRFLATRRDIWLVLYVMFGVAVCEALLGIAQGTVLASLQHVSADRGVRVVGTFGQPNPFAGYLNLTLPILLALAAWGKPLTVRWLSGAGALVLGCALALTQSRGAALGLAGAMLAMAWLGWPSMRRWVLSAVAGVLSSIGVALATHRLTVPVLLERLGWRPLTNAALSGQVTDANFSTLERLAHWAAAVRMIAAHPLGGVGIGNYAAAYPRYAVPRWSLALGHAHNLYLNMAAEIGILGGILYLVWVGVGLWLVWPYGAFPTPSATSVEGWDPPIMGIFGVGVALALHNLFDDLTTHSMLMQWILLIMCAQMLPLARLHKGSINFANE